MRTITPLFLTLLTAAAVLTSTAGSHAQSTVTPTILHNLNGIEGANPTTRLVLASDGNFYGTAPQGGNSGNGTIFQITSAGVLTKLHDFSTDDVAGYLPNTGLIQASDGNLYGTTFRGGSTGFGTVYKVNLSNGSTVTPIYTFTGGADGYDVQGDLIQGTDGNLYGTTLATTNSAPGTIFKLTIHGVLTTLHNFDSLDNSSPGGLLQASDGNFYGTTIFGGSGGKGRVFKITAGGTYSTVVEFNGLTAPYVTDSALIEGSDGNFYGTSYNGGVANTGTVYKVTPGGGVTVLHSFIGDDGTRPTAGLVQGSDGSFFGATTTGGTLNSGTLFKITSSGSLTSLYSFPGAVGVGPSATLVKGNDDRYYGSITGDTQDASTNPGMIFAVNLEAVPGTVAFASSTATVAENAGSVLLTLSRTGGSTGAVSVDTVTTDGTAVDGVDYTGGSTTFTWADGDAADKTLLIPIINRGITDGTTKSFTVTLANATGGVALGTVLTATVNILDNDTVLQPTIEITSPPADTTVVSGAAVPFAVSVSDPGGIATQVQFFLNGNLYASTGASGPFTLNATAPQPGVYTIMAVVTDTEGRTNTSTRTVTVVAPSETDPTPTATFFGGLNGRSLGGGNTITLVASAESLSPDGTPLAVISFYADNDLIASFDGSGNPIDSTPLIHPGTGKRPSALNAYGRRLADTANPAAAGSVFTTPWTIPNVDKLINLLVVAKTTSGVSQVSAPVTVTAVATSATSNHAPIAALSGITSGQIISTGATVNVPVTASDPDAGSTLALGKNGRRRSALHRNAIGDIGSVISQVEFYLNQAKIATSTTAPYSADINPTMSGTFVIQAIVTDDAGLSGVTDPVTILALNTPTVTLSLPGTTTNKTALLEGGPALKIRVTRPTTDVSQPLTVNYKVKGANVAGVDYKTLSGKVTIPAGAAGAKIKLRVFDDGVADGDKVLKLRLTPSTDGSYIVGAPVQVKIRVIDLQGVQ